MTSKEVKEGYYGYLDYEGIINDQLKSIANFRNNKRLELYEESIDTLVLMLPITLRELATKYKRDNNVNYDLSNGGKKNYDDLWIYCNKILEENKISFKYKTRKVYE